MAGWWESDEETARDRELYEKDYAAWYAKHNDPTSETKRFLKATFPGLKGEPDE